MFTGYNLALRATVAKLVDAAGLGPAGSNSVEVQVLSVAPPEFLDCWQFCNINGARGDLAVEVGGVHIEIFLRQ